MTQQPWYRTTLRWAQTNLVESDPTRYDAAWWRNHWRETCVQGVIVNAGGIVAYYPSRFELQHRAQYLGDRDLYGEVVEAAREVGLAVIARMDSNRVANDFYRVHPDWVCMRADGTPYTQADKYITCINSDYYTEYLPQVMVEIIDRSHPDGFADNSWAGLPRESICHCENCARAFRDRTRLALPTREDWSNESYRAWVRWNYARRVEIWDLNNRITTGAGGPDCCWLGMISGDMLNNSRRFIDLKQILPRSPIVMLDHQHRSVADGFAQNTEAGLRLHSIAGWDVLIPESTPQYQLGRPAFRLASMPPAEVRLWASAGFAGGIQPWWHHIGALHDDRRQYKTAKPIFEWHETNQDILTNREPLADVGVVWSGDNNDFWGRGEADERAINPYRGAIRALDEAGLTYLPIHADDLERLSGRVGVLILPCVAAMSNSQIIAAEAFIAAGGSVIATGETGCCDASGDPRDESRLARLFGLKMTGDHRGSLGSANPNLEVSARHTYLRLSPELRAGQYGPADPSAPSSPGTRHPILDGLDDTDTLPFGGYLSVATCDNDVDVLATFVPDFPIFPPETSWMRQPRTDIPAITAKTLSGGSRLVWLLADLDRCLARDGHADHRRIIVNAVRWCLGRQEQVHLEGHRGVMTATLYRQRNRLVLHLNNRLVVNQVPARQDALIPIGPIQVRLAVTDTTGLNKAESIALRVAGGTTDGQFSDGLLSFEVDSVLDHEVAVIDLH